MQRVLGYGESINVANCSLINRLKVKIEPSNVVVKGFGNQIMFPKGMSWVTFNFKTFCIKSYIHFVDANMGDIEVIIGQPIINNKHILMNIQGNNLTLSKIQHKRSLPIILQENVTIAPYSSISVPITTHNQNCLYISARTYGFPEHSIPSTLLTKSIDSLTVINAGSNTLRWLKGRILARAVEVNFLQAPNECLTKGVKQIWSLNLLDIQVNQKALKEPYLSQFYKLLSQFRNCFAKDASELGVTSLIEFET